MSDGQRIRRFFPRRAVIAVTAAFFGIPLAFLLFEFAAATVMARTSPEIIAWIDEDRRIHANNLAKSYSQWGASMDAPPVWRSRGIRVPLHPPPGRRRIVVTGDSFVWGAGHANINDVWWRQLERELRRRGYDVDVVAVGLSGYSTRQQLEAVRKLVSYGKPDLVIWGYVSNDPDEGMVKHQAANRTPAHWFWRLSLLLSRAFPLTVRSLSFDSYPQWQTALGHAPNVDHYAVTVAELGTFLREERLESFVVTLPNPPHMGAEPVFSDLFRRQGIRWIETADLFRERMPVPVTMDDVIPWMVNPVNGHPGARAMHFYAVVAADEAERRFAKALGPRSEPRIPRPRVNDWMPARMAIRAEGNAITMSWPGDALMPRLPLHQPYVQLSLADAVKLDRIVIRARQVATVHLFATVINREGYDDGRMLDLGSRQGTDLEWVGIPRDINTLRMVASFAGADRAMSVELHGGPS